MAEVKEKVVGPHVSIKADTIYHTKGFNITNTLLTSVVVFLLFLVISVLYTREFGKKTKSKFFYFITFAVRSVYGLFQSVLGDKINYFFPLVGAFFFFILLQNEFGLIPGVGSILVKVVEGNEAHYVPLLRGNTTDLNTTLALALISVSFSQYVGIKHLGFLEYMKKFVNFKNPMGFFVGIMETISELSKIISLSFRLFGNIFAGEVIISIMAFLIPILISFPFLLFEIFIGLIQAIIFAMLSTVFFSLAMEKAH